jgi:antitoxin component YwqK of YwqJK toxin-antitoxin module
MEDGEEVEYAENQETPYSGWIKFRNLFLYQSNNGKIDGLKITWYYNGQKASEETYKDGKLMTFATWKPNGEKCPVTKVVNGNGVLVRYYDDGTERSRHTYKDSEAATSVIIDRYDNGQKKAEHTYNKDGKRDGLWTRWYSNGQKMA